MMDKEEWRQKYTDRLIKRGGYTGVEAIDAFLAGMGDYEYDDPVDAADETLSYYGD